MKIVHVLIISLSALLSMNAYAQESDGVILADLERGLDGRSPVDKIPDSVLIRIAEESILLEKWGVTPEFLRKAKEREQLELDALFNNKQATMLKGIISVSTDPSANSPTIYTTPGHDTLVNVIDQTGEPWPVVLASSGNDLLFKTEVIPDHAFKNIFRLVSEHRVGSSNLTLLLDGRSLSITLKMVNDKSKYHPHPIQQISENGPLAKVNPYITSNTGIRNDLAMKNLIFGVAPPSYEAVPTDSDLVKIWRKNGVLLMSTKLTPINPVPTSFYNGPSGYSAYEMDEWPKIIMADDNGIEHLISILGD